jgi:ABC-type Fe3+-hydroxamate transport system substrate-binding protein
LQLSGGSKIQVQGWYICLSSTVKKIIERPICHRTIDDIITEEWKQLTVFRENRIYPISCDTICRPGPRLIDGVEKLHRFFQNIEKH